MSVARSRIPHVEIKKLVGNVASPVILDIGANDGQESWLMMEQFISREVKVYSFEPDPRVFPLLLKLAYYSNGRIFPHQLALYDRAGQMEFYLSNGTHPIYNMPWYQASSLRPATQHLKEAIPWMTTDEKVVVEVTTLDQWSSVHGVSHVDFAWVDVEGSTDALIRGGQETLKNTRYFYSEYTDTERFKGEPLLDELIGVMGPDFEVVEVFQNDVLFRNKKLT